MKHLPQYGLLLLVALGAVECSALAANPPIVDLNISDDWDNLVRLPSAPGVTHIKRLRAQSGFVQSQLSTDGGNTWGPTVNERAITGSTNPIATFDLQGDLNIIRTIVNGSFLEIWHTRSDGANPWTNTINILPGQWIPSMIDAETLSANSPWAGRIVVPFAQREADISPTPPTGNQFTTVLYSDDRGATWTRSASELRSPAPSDFNGSLDGTVWPDIVELQNHDLFMLARNQSGRLYQSRSNDGGETWESASASSFYSSIGMPRITRLDNGDLVLLWNNCTNPPRYDNDGPGGQAPRVWYAGRDVLHAAISSDDGLTWKGFREIHLAPNRNLDPEEGDSGTAAPFAVSTEDSHLLIITGQRAGRAQIQLDPQWLRETDRSDDFTSGNLDSWVVYKSYGPVGVPSASKRQRVQGPVLTNDPDPKLHIRKPDDKDPDGATWNFPMTARGRTDLRLKLNSGFQGATIALADRYFEPTDPQGETQSLYRLDFSASGALAGAGSLSLDTWHDLSIDWRTDKRKAVIRRDGAVIGVLEAQSNVEIWPGLSYLRLRSAATSVDLAGYLVDSVSHDGSNLRDAERLSTAEATAALTTGPDFTRIRFDEYVPNPGINGVIATFDGGFDGFVQGINGADSVGLAVATSTGPVTFSDNNSAQVSSDLYGPQNGETMTLRFVDPTDPDWKATVSEISLRTGSMVADNVSVQAYDADGNELPDWVFTRLPAGTNGVLGFRSTEDLQAKSLIHSLVFSGAGADVWLIGSFNIDPGAEDLAFAGFQIAGERWQASGGGQWNDAANWRDAPPAMADSVALFDSSILSPATVELTGPVTLGKLRFDSAQSYTLSGNATLTLDVEFQSQAKISVLSGSHSIATPIEMLDNTTIDVAADGAVALIAGINGNADLTKTGAGRAIMGQSDVDSLVISQGLVELSGNITADLVSIDSSATMDIASAALVLHDSSSAAANDLRTALASGFNGGSWNGTGIISSTISAGLGVGYGGEGDALIVRLALHGDANLDDAVNTLDFNLLAGSFGSTGAEWVDGDFNYDSVVDASDFNHFAANYGKVFAPIAATIVAPVPEPGITGVSVVAWFLVLRRLRKGRCA